MKTMSNYVVFKEVGFSIALILFWCFQTTLVLNWLYQSYLETTS